MTTPPPINPQTPPPLPAASPAGGSFPRQAALFSLLAPFFCIALNFGAHQAVQGNRASLMILGGTCTLLILLGLVFGIVALLGMKTHGTKGILGKAAAGVCINGVLILFMLIAIPTFLRGSHSSGSLTTLPSGRQIRITGIGPMHFPNGTSAMILNCETDISIADKANLRKEVNEIWSGFRKDVETAGTTTGVIRITHPTGSGLVTQSQGYGFVFEKRPDGQWHCLQDEKK
jgi:hypothetical protein